MCDFFFTFAAMFDVSLNVKRRYINSTHLDGVCFLLEFRDPSA